MGDPAQLPQVFVPYKDVLPLLPGITLPEGVTLVWPDDNSGYIRQFPHAAQARRAGHSGIDYHLSSLGAPLSYLWPATTPPALVAEEMGRAFDAGADRVWIANAGDIKPHEVNLSHWFDLACNPAAVRAQAQGAYPRDLAVRLFGTPAANVAAIWDGYYRLNFERRPGHLQFHLPGPAPAAALATWHARHRLGPGGARQPPDRLDRAARPCGRPASTAVAGVAAWTDVRRRGAARPALPLTPHRVADRLTGRRPCLARRWRATRPGCQPASTPLIARVAVGAGERPAGRPGSKRQRSAACNSAGRAAMTAWRSRSGRRRRASDRMPSMAGFVEPMPARIFSRRVASCSSHSRMRKSRSASGKACPAMYLTASWASMTQRDAAGQRLGEDLLAVAGVWRRGGQVCACGRDGLALRQDGIEVAHCAPVVGPGVDRLQHA